MGDYLRTTRECPIDSLKPVISTAIRVHIEKYELGEVEASALICCKTTSTRKKRGWFSSKTEVIITDVILTPKWMILATGKENRTPAVISARLQNIQVQDYEKSNMYKLVQDNGLSISGLYTDSSEGGSIFIGLGPEPAAQKFREILREEIGKV
jgi:hypothetical protein